MPICSYLVVASAGTSHDVHTRLSAMPGCDAVRAENRDVLLLVTETPGLEEEAELRRTVEGIDGIEALLLTFGEIDPDADISDPIGRRRR